ncbi:MAG: DM13 domain-containing protein [Actinobacteria bacterium]|nr:DM13 domain-containing protein [Actinomycetota bacterium]MBW3614778.1 DM13 domain-containing protein [Actinomycetota bacterium]
MTEENAAAAVAVLDLAAATEDPDRPLPGQPDKPTSIRRLVGAAVLVLMGLSAAYSNNAFGLRDRFRPPSSYLGGRTVAPPAAQGPAVGDVPVARPVHDIRSQPWWQPLTTLRGAGSATTETFTIDRHALQWRVKWKCSDGSFGAIPVPESRRGARPRPLAQAPCPGQGTGFSVRTGRYAIQVTAAGPWEMTVEQQVDSPMVEPPPPGIDSPEARVLATGSFYDVDRVGKGTVRIVDLADGRRVLRLDDFFVSINSDLEIWFSEHPKPTSTPEAASAPHRRLEFLKATAGAMNYEVPADLDVSRYRSIVIWCELTSNAYSAATLQR